MLSSRPVLALKSCHNKRQVKTGTLFFLFKRPTNLHHLMGCPKKKTNKKTHSTFPSSFQVAQPKKEYKNHQKHMSKTHADTHTETHKVPYVHCELVQLVLAYRGDLPLSLSHISISRSPTLTQALALTFTMASESDNISTLCTTNNNIDDKSTCLKK